MNFASPIFLFAFLPLVLIAYHLLRPIRAKNVLLIAAGLVFYAFGDLRHLPLLLASCALHYGVGLALMRARRGRRLLLAACVTVDLAVLAAYKWHGALPLGISFYTFQAISYIVDVSRAPQSGTRSFRRALQYLTFFPQLTAGPLMRFSEVQPLLDTRHVTWDGAFDGCSRFICGLAKKLLLAAAAAQLANAVYAQTSFDALCAWTGAVCYCLQLYFDFSGYSDMAVGLGLLFKEAFAPVLAEMDKQLGRFIKTLDELGVGENTIIIFTSDNGPAPSFKSVRSAYLRGTKNSLYEGGIRMPFIVRYPKKIKAGQVNNESVLCAVDLYPTLCSIAGIKTEKGYKGDGQNYSKVLLGKSEAKRKTDLMWDFGRNKHFGFPGNPYDRSPHLAIRSGKWKLLVNGDGSDAQLYDMEKDKFEKNNIANEHPDLVAKLSKKVCKWYEENKDKGKE